MSKRKNKTTNKEQVSNSNTLLDFAGADLNRDTNDKPNQSSKSTIDDLGDIFSSEAVSKNIADPIKPVSLLTNGNYYYYINKQILSQHIQVDRQIEKVCT